MSGDTVHDVPTHHVERMRGIEPPSQAWEACVLPLNHIRSAWILAIGHRRTGTYLPTFRAALPPVVPSAA